MSEETNPLEDQQEEVQEEETNQEDDLVCGYAVGLKDNGEFVFDVVGKNPGLVQLLGLHQYANHRIIFAKDMSQGYGFPVVMKQLTQISQLLQGLINMANNPSGEK